MTAKGRSTTQAENVAGWGWRRSYGTDGKNSVIVMTITATALINNSNRE